MKFLRLCAVLALCLAPMAGNAQLEVQDIRVEGLQRISAGTFFSYLPVAAGDQMSPDDFPEVIRSLMQTGFFTDVRLSRVGGVLVVRVVERPAIAAIRLSGNKDISDEDLLGALEQVGLAEGRIFDRSLLDRMQQELREQYFARGKYGVRVESEVTELERNRVEIALDIYEGEVARIRQISLVGNERFDDDELMELFKLTTPGWLTWWSKRDRYSKPQLTADLESLRSFYLDRGFLAFTIESTQVSITPDRNDIYLTINISEGEQYSVSDVRLAGELVLPEEQLMKLVAVRPGETFSRSVVTASAAALGDYLGARGYAFANVNTVPEVDETDRTVAVAFYIDPGRRVYVRRINFAGNYRTHDEVLRREMRQMEGGWFSTQKVDLSKVRLQRLGFFDDVSVETPSVPGTTDLVDVNFGVTERQSGNLVVGLGYSQGSGLLFNAQVSQNNFLGSGKRVSFAFNNSNVNRIYSFAYNNPYYTVDGVSRGFNVFYRETNADDANLSDYTLDRIGGDMSFGFPLTETNSIRLSAGLEHTKVSANDDDYVQGILDDKGDDAFLNYVGSVSWATDSRNRAIFPTKGNLQKVSGEVAVPGSDWQYYKLDYEIQQFFPLFLDLTGALNAELGYGDGYGDDDALPFFENYFAGGIRSVRGFKSNSLGPREDDDPIGGAFKTVGTAEILVPISLTDENLRNVRLSGFFDIGTVFPNVDDFDRDDLRYSVGMSVIWLSPFGPLTLSIAEPLNDEPEDETEAFQFTLGTPF